MCMKNYGVSHADGYKQSSGQFAEAYNRGDFARKDPVVQNVPQEPIPTEPTINQPFVPALKEDQQSPLWNPSSLAEPADLPVAAAVEDVPVVDKSQDLAAATELFNKEFTGKSPESHIDEILKKSPVSDKERDSIRMAAVNEIKSKPKKSGRDWYAFFEKRSSAPKKVNDLLAKALTSWDDVDIIQGIHSPEVMAENTRRGYFDAALMGDRAQKNTVATVTPKSEFGKGYNLVQVPTIKAGGQ